MAALRRNRRTDAGIAGDMTQAFAVPDKRRSAHYFKLSAKKATPRSAAFIRIELW